jgi:hypothetical protein
VLPKKEKELAKRAIEMIVEKKEKTYTQQA